MRPWVRRPIIPTSLLYTFSNAISKLIGRYNSCVGNLDGKSVVVIFENAQALPEFIVKYEMDEEFFRDS